MSTPSASLPLPIATPARSSVRLRLQQACAWLVMVLAALDFCRWWALTPDQLRFKELIPMAPCTGLGFAILGTALLLQLLWPARWYGRNISLALMAVVVVGGSHALFNRLFGHDAPGWELWLVPQDTSLSGFPSGHLPPVAAGMFLLAAFGLAVLFPPLSESGFLRRIAVTVVLLVEVCAVVTMVSYAAGNPPFSNSGGITVTPLAVFELALFSLGLLLGPDANHQLRQWFFGIDAATPVSAPFSAEERLVLMLLLAVGVFATGTAVLYLRRETDRQQERASEALQALATLKAGQIEQWRRERLGDARILVRMPRLAEAVRQIATGQESGARRVEFVEWLRLFGHSYGYAQIVLFDDAMRPVLAEPAGLDLSLRGLRNNLRLPQTDDVVELPPYTDEAHALHWDLLAPLRTGDNPAPTGAVLLRTDPSRLLIPLVQHWPKEYESGQSALWYRDGNRLVSLGGFRPSLDSTPEQRAPFGMVRSLTGADRESILTRAVRGTPGPREDLDSRGVMVIGVADQVPDSAWWLSSRVDSSEIYAPLRRDAVGIAGLIGVLLTTTSFATSWLWRQRQKNLMHQHLAVELEQKRLAARLGMVMRHAKDIICLVDQDLRVVDANQQAVDTYGWTKEEILRMRTRDFQAPETWSSLGDLVARANTPGGTIFETVHVRKDGGTFPVEVAVRQVEVDGRPHMLAVIRDVTERKRAEGALRASQQRYRLIAENTTDVIWLYDLRAEAFTYISPSVFTLRGYRPEEVITQRLQDSLTPASADEIGHVIQRELSAFAAGDFSRRHVKIEVEQVRKDGSIVPTEVVASLLQDASGATSQILGITRDITERRRAREAQAKFSAELEERVESRTAELAARNSEMQALLDSIPDTVLLCDEQGALVSSHSPANPPASQHPFDGASDRRGEGYERAVREIARAMHAVAWGQPQTVVQEFDRTLDGVTVSIEARATPTGAGRLLILLRDISARKRIERDILANLERERQLSEMKSQFVSVASHEFRTPLAAASGSLELLEKHGRTLTEAKRIELLARTQTALGRLTAIMNDMLNLSRADSGRVKVRRMPVDLSRFMRDVIQEAETGDRAQHRFELEHDGPCSAVPADTNLLHHILSNLLGNAARYSPAGTKIALRLEIGEQAFFLTVADEGIGIPESDRERIFEPFMRGSNAEHIGGTGLGLNIAKRYSELMGGRIELLPSARGATFRVYVPLNQPAS